MMARVWLSLAGLLLSVPPVVASSDAPSFRREVSPLLSRLGCNGGTCHGAVQGQNGFRLSLFGANPELDHAEIVRGAAGRRVDPLRPESSLFLLKATGQIQHGGGRVVQFGSSEYQLLHAWVMAGTRLDSAEANRLTGLTVQPDQSTVPAGAEFRLRVEAAFADGSRRDVTSLSSFTSRRPDVAGVNVNGRVQAVGVGDTALLVRFGSEPRVATVVVSRPQVVAFPEETPTNFVDVHVLEKLRRLNVPPSGVCDDATFLRRACLDVAGRLPTPDEVRSFLTDDHSDKRRKKIESLLAEPGHAALWTLKFCDILGASEFGIYADGLAQHFDAPRFQAWVRARLEENLPYDEFATRILTATSREGRPLSEWAEELVALHDGYTSPRSDLEVYAKRQTLDLYWQRKASNGVPGALQVAHAFLGLRLECAQCHRHPHDVWQQDDLLDFANFFTRVRTVGFQGQNEKNLPEQAELFREYTERGKQLQEEAKQLKEGRGKQLAEEVRKLKNATDRAKAEAATQEYERVQQRIRDLERRGRALSNEVAKRILHAEIFHRTDAEAQQTFAKVSSPLGTQESREFRLLGETEPVALEPNEDPRTAVAEWLQRPDNPFFAKAIVNRVWAHYFGRGLVDPPDDLSPLNPPSHPELLDELCRQFIKSGYDLRALHRTILLSHTYQRSSATTSANTVDQTNYASFSLRRLPAEVLLDAVNTATGTTEKMGMSYYHWPEGLKTVEIPYVPSENGFVAFVLEQFGRPARNSSVQCDCERQTDASMLQVLTLANHPQIWNKVTVSEGRVAQIAKMAALPEAQIEELYLAFIGRLPTAEETQACLDFLKESKSAETGLQGIAWSLLNTREFLLQH